MFCRPAFDEEELFKYQDGVAGHDFLDSGAVSDDLVLFHYALCQALYLWRHLTKKQGFRASFQFLRRLGTRTMISFSYQATSTLV